MIEELQTLLVDHPFRERLWGQLMLALYRCGRQPEALAAYTKARRMLAEEHGLDPGPELARMERAILTHDPELAPPARPTQAPGNLPIPLTTVIGRHEQIQCGAAAAQRLERLQDRCTLLILDNCEHLAAEVARAAAALLGGCADLRVLATSQRALGVPGETLWPVPSLSLPAAGIVDPRELARSDAVQLFKDRAIKVRPSFTLPADTTPAVAEVCRRLDGLPLAIELAAARVTVLPASHIAEALDDRFRLLMATGWQAPPRQKSLRAAVDWSYGLLSNDERALFDQLSVFTGGCSLTEAERVGEQLGLGRFELLDLLGGLVEKSMLLTTEGADGQPRYRMLETLRAYGVEQLRALGRYDLACRRHAELFAALAATSEPQLFGPEHLHWLHRLEEELDNFRAALKYALDRGAADVAVRVAGALGFFFALTGRHTEGRARLQAALAAAGESTNTVDRAQALTYIGYLEGQQSDFERGIEDAERGLALAVASSDGWQIAKSRFILALTLGEAGRNDRTPQLLAKARADFDSIADPRADAGVAACDLVAAEHANREVLIRSQRIGYHLFEAWSRVLTAWIGVQRGKLAIADAELSRAWELVRQLGQSHHIAFVLTLRGRLAMQAGDFDRARSLLTTAVQTVDAIASPWFAALAREALAEAMQRSGNVDAAENLYSQALAVPPGAGAEFAALIVLFVGGSPAGRSLIGLGALARLRGRLAEAQQLQLQGVRRAKRDGDSAAVALGLEGLAASSADTWEIERAVLLLGAAESVRSAAGVATDPFGAAEATRVIAAASSAMTSEELERAIARGRRMRPEEALAAVHRA